MTGTSLARTIAHAAAAALLLGCGACAAPMGQAAGSAVGGATWVALKGGGAVIKTTEFAGRTTYKGARLVGRTGRGAIRGVHEEFSPKDDYAEADDADADLADADADDADSDRTAALSQDDRTSRVARP